MPPRRIRVAFCIDSLGIGGTELNAVRMAEALDPNRFELFVVHLAQGGPLLERYRKLGIRTIHLPISNLYSVKTLTQGIRLAKRFRSWDIDIVHTHDIYTNIFIVPWVRMLTTCSIIASRRWWFYAPRPALVILNRWVYRLAHHVLANSSGVAGLLAREENVSPAKIVEIPNFIHDQAFQTSDARIRAAQRRMWGLPDNVFAIGIVARLHPVKNHDLLLEAFALLSESCHLLIIGDGPSRAELIELGKKLGIESRMHFTGEIISTQNLHQFLDVSVLCSLSEGFPNSIIEAMAAGTPVVATPVGGVTDAISHGVTGMIVPLGDPASLADMLRMLEGDPQMRARLSNAGREFVRKKFYQPIVMEKLSSFYQSLVDDHPPEKARAAA